MEVLNVIPPVTSFLQVKLDKVTVDYLWEIIEMAKSKNINYKSNLVGNISKSLLLEDINANFYKTVCVPLVKFYREKDSQKRDPSESNALLPSNTKLILHDIWVNYQYKTEFNPPHNHSGVYSFAIWLKIPYSWKDQCKLPQFQGVRDNDIKAGNFEFEYIDTLGEIRNRGFRLSPDLEGTMLFFPAKLRHCVFPFYETDEPRVSVAGNLFYAP